MRRIYNIKQTIRIFNIVSIDKIVVIVMCYCVPWIILQLIKAKLDNSMLSNVRYLFIISCLIVKNQVTMVTSGSVKTNISTTTTTTTTPTGTVTTATSSNTPC